MTDHFFKFFYFVGSTVWGHMIMKDEDFLPPELGGKGDVALATSKKYVPFG
jgi:hypothetical protein